MAKRTIQISDSIKQEIAERVVEMAHPGYSKGYQGEWYVVDGSRVVHAQGNRPWDPWHDAADVIAVDDLVNIFGGGNRDRADFWGDDDGDYDRKDIDEIRIEFALGYVPDSYDAAAYEARYA